MNQVLTEFNIRSVSRQLLDAKGNTSGRALRRELQLRFGAVGKVDRVYRIWREEVAARIEAKRPAPVLPPQTEEMHRRMQEAEVREKASLERAERAEMREQAHQDHWAMEIDKLREELRRQPNYAAEVRRLQTRLTQLQVENAALRDALLTHDDPRSDSTIPTNPQAPQKS